MSPLTHSLTLNSREAICEFYFFSEFRRELSKVERETCWHTQRTQCNNKQLNCTSRKTANRERLGNDLQIARARKRVSLT